MCAFYCRGLSAHAQKSARERNILDLRLQTQTKWGRAEPTAHLPEELHELGDQSTVLVVEKGGGHPCVASPARPSNAMDVVVDAIREVVLDDVCHIVDVQPCTGCHALPGSCNLSPRISLYSIISEPPLRRPGGDIINILFVPKLSLLWFYH